MLGAALTGAHFGAGLASDGAAGGVLAVHLVGEGGVSSRVARGDPLFAAAVVSGGAMGVAVAYEFETVDAHDVELCAYRGVHWRAVAGIGTRAAMGLGHGEWGIEGAYWGTWGKPIGYLMQSFSNLCSKMCRTVLEL